jgi:hypothetical protein
MWRGEVGLAHGEDVLLLLLLLLLVLILVGCVEFKVMVLVHVGGICNIVDHCEG